MLQDGALDTPLCRAGLAGELLTLSGQSLVALWEDQVEGLRDDLHESKTMVEQYSKLVNKLAHHKPEDDCFISRHTLMEKLYCRAPEQLFEAEIFGYDSGAFTGALRNWKKGLFELAASGTILLDEVGETPLSIQVKLLRFVQSKEFYHLGGSCLKHTDVRIIAATNTVNSKLN